MQFANMQRESNIVGLVLQKRWLRHMFFWAAALVFSTVIKGFVKIDFEDAVLHTFLFLPTKVVAAYAISYFIIPQQLFRRKYIEGILTLVVVLYLLSLADRIIMVYGYEPLVIEGDFKQESIVEILTDVVALLRRYLVQLILPALFLTSLRFTLKHFESKQQQEQLEKEKAQAELNFLKAQIHPHFLFNTLNNLYTLTLKKSDKAPEMLLKLSEMLDYILYQCAVPTVPIKKEIELLDNYIELEKLRYGDRLDLRFEKDIDNDQAQVSPLLLLSLVENAFKHGASGDIGKPVIQLAVKVRVGRLHFRAFNTKPDRPQEDKTGFKKGIGASNVRRQLDLSYPGAYEMQVVEDINSYELTLEINLEGKTA